MKLPLLLCLCFWGFISSALGQANQTLTKSGFTNAANFGFSPTATGLQNTQALQKAVDQGGTIRVSEPGTYNLAGTVYLGSNTSLQFGNGVFIKKVNEQAKWEWLFWRVLELLFSETRLTLRVISPFVLGEAMC